MRYFALATDFDGTLARDSHVPDCALEALTDLRKTGRFTILVTGRILEDLEQVFGKLELFDLVVAENGGLLYDPKRQTRVALGSPPPERFVERLRERGVQPLETGECIVATWEPHEQTVLETIRELGLELQVVFNKGAVMVLPSGVNKASGLAAALDHLGLSAHNVVGVGDAENDHAFLALCECAAAVANALPAVKESADLVLTADHGDGVALLVSAMLVNDLASEPVRADAALRIGTADGRPVALAPHQLGATVVAGTSGGGKSTLASAILERLIEAGYQTCVVDPEGDYDALDGAVVLGDAGHPPALDEVENVLKNPRQNVVINLLGLALDERPKYFAALFGRLSAMRSALGRPHWVILDEAHHVLPASHEVEFLDDSYGLMLVTVNPRTLSEKALRITRQVIAVGDRPSEMLREAVGPRAPETTVGPLPQRRALLWNAEAPERAVQFDSIEPKGEKQRHRRKYATGDLPSEKSFYFRGPAGTLNLRAHNLATFIQLARGIDDETWQYHLAAGHIARWFEEMIDDKEMADACRRAADLEPKESRQRVIEEIERRYTAPVS